METDGHRRFAISRESLTCEYSISRWQSTTHVSRYALMRRTIDLETVQMPTLPLMFCDWKVACTRFAVCRFRCDSVLYHIEYRSIIDQTNRRRRLPTHHHVSTNRTTTTPCQDSKLITLWDLTLVFTASVTNIRTERRALPYSGHWERQRWENNHSG